MRTLEEICGRDIANKIRNGDPSLTRLDLRGGTARLNDEDVEIIADELLASKNTVVSALILSGNNITKKGIASLSNLKFLKSLDISNNNLGNESIEILVKMTHLQALRHDETGICNMKMLRRRLALLDCSKFPLAIQIRIQQCVEDPNFGDLFNKLSTISMLTPVVLALLYILASESKKSILEIGPYIGGSTIAMATAVKDRNSPFISIECGGMLKHPSLPSQNILEDLRNNLSCYDISDRVTVIPQHAHKSVNILQVLLYNQKVDLLFIDADGVIEFHLSYLCRFLSDHCILVFDDYTDPEKGPKMLTDPLIF